MKTCPTCNRTYSDETLSYCLADGSLLSAPYDPEATQVYSPSRITNPAETEALPPAAPVARQKQSNSLTFKFIVVTLLALAAGGGIMAWLNSGAKEAASTSLPADKASDVAKASTTPTSKPISPSSGVRAPLGITATASSQRSPESGVTYNPGNVIDQSLTTAWDEGVDGPGIGEWVRCDFDREVKLNRIIITPGYFKTPEIWRMNNRLAAATFYFSDGSSRRFTFPDRMVEQKLDVGGIRAHWVRMEISDIYSGSADSQDTPISNMAFDWE